MHHDWVINLENITLRPLLETDLEIVRSWRNDAYVRKWFLNDNIIEKEQQLEWYNNYLNNENDLMFIIEENQHLKKPVGALALYNINWEALEAEFGRLMIGEPEARGKGYAKIAIFAICKHALTVMGLKRIYLSVIAENKLAINIYTKVGFKYVSTSKVKKGNKSKVVYLMDLSGEN